MFFGIEGRVLVQAIPSASRLLVNQFKNLTTFILLIELIKKNSTVEGVLHRKFAHV